MSVAKAIREHVLRIRLAEPFTNKQFLKLGSRASVDKALSRLVSEGVIQRIIRGVFMRPESNRYIGMVAPGVREVVEVMAKDRGDIIQVQGADAANLLGLSTQIPMRPIFYTSGPSREFKIGNLTVQLRHVSRRKLLLAGKTSGIAISALWYLGKNNVNLSVVRTIRARLTEKDFEELKGAQLPAWMASALEKYGKEAASA